MEAISVSKTFAGLDLTKLSLVKTEKREVRNVSGEMRTEEDAGKRYISGYAARFNSLSQDLGGWKERIMPGAFARALANKADVRHVINHNKNYILGKTSAGTTLLWEDEIGLRFKTLLGNRSYEKDLVESMERGEVKECSFQFAKNGKDGDRWVKGDGPGDIRELLDVDLFDVSIITADPAYTQPSAELTFRSMFPDGVPEELLEHIKPEVDGVFNQVALTADEITTGTLADIVPVEKAAPIEEVVAPTADAEEDACSCECESCVAGNCDNCTNTGCTDELCACTASTDAAEAAELVLITAALQELEVRWRHGLGREVRAVSDADTLDLYMYDDIGESWFSEGITVNSCRRAVAAYPDAKKIRVRLNSFGGDAFEGVAIGNYLKSLGKPIQVYIDGLAASAASIIAMCGEVTMAPNAMMMIHNVSSGVYGYASDMRKMADVLDIITKATANTYVKKTKQKMADIREQMDAETWMDAATCMKLGFADSVADPGAEDRSINQFLPVSVGGIQERYKNLPERFMGPSAQEISDAEMVAEKANLEQSEARKRRLRLAQAAA